jgi:hypothetical protein
MVLLFGYNNMYCSLSLFCVILKYLYHIISTVFLACNIISYTGVRLLVHFAAPLGMKEKHI